MNSRKRSFDTFIAQCCTWKHCFDPDDRAAPDCDCVIDQMRAMARATVPAMETIVIVARQVTVTLRPWVEGGCLGRNIRIKLRSRLVVPQNTSNGTPSFFSQKFKLKRGELGSKGQCLHTNVEWHGCIFYHLGRALNFSMAIFGPFWPKLPFGVWQEFFCLQN